MALYTEKASQTVAGSDLFVMWLLIWLSYFGFMFSLSVDVKVWHFYLGSSKDLEIFSSCSNCYKKSNRGGRLHMFNYLVVIKLAIKSFIIDPNSVKLPETASLSVAI